MRKFIIEVDAHTTVSSIRRLRYELDQVELQTLLDEIDNEDVRVESAERLMAYVEGQGVDGSAAKLIMSQAEVDALIQEIGMSLFYGPNDSEVVDERDHELLERGYMLQSESVSFEDRE